MNIRRILMLVLMAAAVCLTSVGVGAAEEVNVTLAGRYDTAEEAMDVIVSGNYAYVADSSNGLVILDISDSTAPILAGHYDTADVAKGVTVSGNYAYVADREGLVILDISDSTVPVLTGQCKTLGGWAESVTVSGNYAYVADTMWGLVVMDISDPTAPTIAANCQIIGWVEGLMASDEAMRKSGEPTDVAVSGDYAYVALAGYYHGLTVVDISHPTAPNVVATLATIDRTGGTTEGQAWAVVVSEDYAYIANDQNGLVIVDISNPTAPTLAGRYNTAEIAEDITVSGNYAYVAGDYGGLVVVDISDPTEPTFAGSYNTAGRAKGITVSGNYAYVADEDNGLVILHTGALGEDTRPAIAAADTASDDIPTLAPTEDMTSADETPGSAGIVTETPEPTASGTQVEKTIPGFESMMLAGIMAVVYAIRRNRKY